MESTEKAIITVGATINAPLEKVWELWTTPHHIMHWNYASDDWQTTRSEIDLRTGGKFMARMEANDGSQGFDFTGKITKVEKHNLLEYIMGDGRKVRISFIADGNKTKITETFEAEQTNTIELQRNGWQAILDNFKKYAETFSRRMELKHFEIPINASAKKVYSIMLDKETYAEWTTEFGATSHFKGSWKKGSRILFLGTDSNGKTAGMISHIKENIPNKFVSIVHVGFIEGDKEITQGLQVDELAGALKNYTFSESNGKTLLAVDIDVTNQFKSFFEETWPKALKKLKTICEK